MNSMKFNLVQYLLNKHIRICHDKKEELLNLNEGPGELVRLSDHSKLPSLKAQKTESIGVDLLPSTYDP